MIWLLPTFSEICRLQAEEGVGASGGVHSQMPPYDTAETLLWKWAEKEAQGDGQNL